MKLEPHAEPQPGLPAAPLSERPPPATDEPDMPTWLSEAAELCAASSRRTRYLLSRTRAPHPPPMTPSPPSPEHTTLPPALPLSPPSVSFVRGVSWAERDAALRQHAIPLPDTPAPSPASLTASASPPPQPTEPFIAPRTPAPKLSPSKPAARPPPPRRATRVAPFTFDSDSPLESSSESETPSHLSPELERRRHERRFAPDGHSYTEMEFESYFQDFGAQWRTAAIDPAVPSYV